MKSLSRVLLSATPWTVAYQLLHAWDFPGKNTGVGYHFLLQEIFLTQGLNPGLPHCRQTLYHLSYQGSLRWLRWATMHVKFHLFGTRLYITSLVVQMVKRLPTVRETWVQTLDREDLLEKEMITHSSILAWKIPCMEEPGRLQSMGSQRVRHDWASSLSLSLFRFNIIV